MRAKDFKTDLHTIRNWEIQNPAKFHSQKVSGNNVADLIPPGFVYGCNIYLRDILFLYPNKYDNLDLVIKDTVGKTVTRWVFTLERYNSKSGPAYFIDVLLKPLYNHSYTIELPQLPALPSTHELRYKVHYRAIYKEEWNTIHPDITYIMEQRLLSESSNFSRKHKR